MQIDLLVFNRAPESFDEHVVAPTALAVHADLDRALLQQASERLAGELTDHQVVGFDANELVGTGQKFKASVLRSASDNGITIYNNVESLLQALEKK